MGLFFLNLGFVVQKNCLAKITNFCLFLNWLLPVMKGERVIRSVLNEWFAILAARILSQTLV
jgi:hypothetical protein